MKQLFDFKNWTYEWLVWTNILLLLLVTIIWTILRIVFTVRQDKIIFRYCNKKLIFASLIVYFFQLLVNGILIAGFFTFMKEGFLLSNFYLKYIIYSMLILINLFAFYSLHFFWRNSYFKLNGKFIYLFDKKIKLRKLCQVKQLGNKIILITIKGRKKTQWTRNKELYQQIANIVE